MLLAISGWNFSGIYVTKIWSSHSIVAEDSSLAVCYTVSLDEWFPTFWRTGVPSSSWSRNLDLLCICIYVR